MGEVSADPLVMLEYCGSGREQVEGWRSGAEDLRTALEGLAAGLGSVPSEFCAGVTARAAEDLAGRFEGLVAEQEHQDGYVCSVAEAVLEADGFDYVLTGNLPVTGEELAWPDGVLTVPDGALNGVGSTTRFESVAGDAVLDAERGLELLTDAGLLDALDDGLGFDELQDSVHGIDSDGELAVWLEEVGPRLEEDPLYAAAFYNALGSDGLNALAGLFLGAGGMAEINEGAGWEDAESIAPGGGEWVHHVGDPFINGLADATRTGYLDTEIFGSLLSFETENDRLAAAVMFSAEGDRYDGWTLGRVAQTILGEGHLYDNPNEYLTEADAFMMRALAENPDAAYWFVVDDAGEPVDEYLEMLLDPNPDLSYLANTDKGSTIENIWFNDQNLSTMHEFWMASAYFSLVPDEVAYEFRDFNGNRIEGHPWRDEEFWLGDPRFLEGQGYDGWYDPTEGDEHTLYTIWVGEPDSELEPLAFFYDHRPDDMSMAIDVMPFLGQAKALYEVFAAEDPVSGDEVNRWIALGGFVVGAALSGVGAYPAGKALLNWTKTQLRNHPPIPHITASAHMPTPGPNNFNHPGEWNAGGGAVDPLQNMSNEDLTTFKEQFVELLYSSELDTNILDGLSADHPFSGLTTAELSDLSEEIIFRLNRQLDEAVMDDSGIRLPLGDFLPDEHLLQGISDWELYELFKPLVGEVDVSIPSVHLHDPDPTNVFNSGTANPYNDGQIYLTDQMDSERYAGYMWGDIHLSYAEARALYAYGDTDYDYINTHLRGYNNATPETLEYIHHLDTALDRGATRHTVHTTRVIDLNHASGMFPDLDHSQGFPDSEGLADLPIGYRVTDPAYQSTSLNNNYRFSEVGMWEPVVINLEVPPGTPAWAMTQPNRNFGIDYQSELLLGRGLTWEITSTPRLEDGVWIIDAKIVND